MAVYFIRAGEGGPVKIGYGADAEGRIADLQTAHYETLVVMRAIEGGLDEENWLHRHYAERRIRGEWFHYCPTMETVEPPIKEIRERAKRNRPPAPRIIALLGGATAIARELGHKNCTTVQSWNDRGIVPMRNVDALAAIAARRGVDVDIFDFIGGKTA